MMVPVQGGRYLPFELGYGRIVHECVPLDRTPPTPTAHRFEGDGAPKTRKIQCWWCGDRVFYHTNGNGDSVLLDELGPPWPVHYCWELHRESRRQHVHRYLDGLTDAVGMPSQPAVEWPDDVENLKVTDDIKCKCVVVSGYVFGWRLVPGASETVLHNPSNLKDWIRIRVVGSAGVGYPVWVPGSHASEYGLNDLVCFVCRLVPWGPRWYLVALRSEVVHYLGRQVTPSRLAHVGRSNRCRYCGDPLRREEVEWGLDENLRPECRTCHDFRSGRTPERFQELCRKVSAHGRM
jgi:hypothetical protein